MYKVIVCILLLSINYIDCIILKEDHKSSKSWKQINYFAFSPFESRDNHGDYYGVFNIDIYHNYITNDNRTEEDLDLYSKTNFVRNDVRPGEPYVWILGYHYNRLNDYQQDFSADADASSLSCTQMIDKAVFKFRLRSKGDINVAYLNDKFNAEDDDEDIQAVNEFRYVNAFKGVITKDTFKKDGASFIFWTLLNCNPFCNTTARDESKYFDPFSDQNNGLCYGPLNAYIREHFYHTTGSKVVEGKAVPDPVTGSGGINSPTTDPDAPAFIEASFEYFAIRDIFICFWVFQTLLCIFALYVRADLSSKNRDHYTVYLLFIGTFFYNLKYLFGMCYYSLLENTGKSQNGLLIASSVFQIFADVLILLLLCLLGHGWTIVRRKIKMVGRVRLTLLITSYLMFSISSLIWKEEKIDYTGQSLIFYDSPPGTMLLVVLVMAFLRFCGTISNTMRTYEEHHEFFHKLRIFGSIYILQLPLCAIFVIGSNPLYKINTYTLISCFVTFGTQLLLLLCYHPFFTDSHTFPFHAQIEDMKQYKFKQSKQLAGEKVTWSGVISSLPRLSTIFSSGKKNKNQSFVELKPEIISFTGGYNSNIDSNGKLIPPSLFDRRQLSKLRSESISMGERLTLLNEYYSKLSNTFDKISITDPIDEQPVEANASFNRSNYTSNRSRNDYGIESSYNKDKWERQRYESLNSNIQKSPSFKNEENDEFNEKPNNHNVKQKKINEGFKNPNGGDDKKSSNNLLDVLNSQSDSSITNSLESPKKVKKAPPIMPSPYNSPQDLKPKTNTDYQIIDNGRRGMRVVENDTNNEDNRSSYNEDNRSSYNDDDR